MITVVGIGNKANQITGEGLAAIKAAKTLVVRTFKTNAGAELIKFNAISLDDIYTQADDFNNLNSLICDKLALLADKDNVVYCVDGDGISDTSVQMLYSLGLVSGIVSGVSLGYRRPGLCLTSVSAYEFTSADYYLDSACDLSVFSIDNKLIAGTLKLKLCDIYDDETDIIFCHLNKPIVIKLYELDRQKSYNYSTCIFLQGNASLNKQKYTFADLMRIMSRLTGRGGCPWDAEQTHESIRENMIEEAYEAADAIDSGDIDAIREEVGDVLLQAIFHCDIAKRFGEFGLNDSITQLCAKLYSRHTHIFGINKADSGDAALNFWEKAKAEEKGYSGLFDKLNRLPKCFPVALRGKKIIKKLNKEDESFKNKCGEIILQTQKIIQDSEDFDTKQNEKIEKLLQAVKSLEGK